MAKVDSDTRYQLYNESVFEAWEELYSAAVDAMLALRRAGVLPETQRKLNQALDNRPSRRYAEKLDKLSETN